MKRRASVTEMPLRRDKSHVETFSNEYPEDMNAEFSGRARTGGVRVSFRGGLVPKSLLGRIAAGGALLVIAGATVGTTMWARSFLLSDEHFTVPNSAAIQIAGNSHLTRAQLLSVFGEDVDRNVFRIPLQQRKTELESLPWVAHATVMRLLPNRIRVGIVERTPVAFVRNGTQIGLVDSHGVLFEMTDAQVDSAGHTLPAPHYSFPVLTGISPADPVSTRAARMKLYMDFMADLDSGGEGISKKVSEVDLSNPDDVRAIIPDAQASNVLIHFGEDRFLERYRQYQQHLTEWTTQCPRLSSVDMRYDQQVVLEPCPPAADSGTTAAAAASTARTPAPVAASRPAVAQRPNPKKAVVAPRKNFAKAKGKPAHAGLHGAAR